MTHRHRRPPRKWAFRRIFFEDPTSPTMKVIKWPALIHWLTYWNPYHLFRELRYLSGGLSSLSFSPRVQPGPTELQENNRTLGSCTAFEVLERVWYKARLALDSGFAGSMADGVSPVDILCLPSCLPVNLALKEKNATWSGRCEVFKGNWSFWYHGRGHGGWGILFHRIQHAKHLPEGVQHVCLNSVRKLKALCSES